MPASCPCPTRGSRALDAIVHAAQIVPATVEFVDIAGLVARRLAGEGLGNQFLAHIREVDAIVHVVRCFEDANVVHVEGGVDPIRDIETIDTELGLADLDTVERRLDRARRTAKGGAVKGAKEELAFFEALYAHLAAGAPARSFPTPDDQLAALRECHLLTAKPVLYVENVDEAGLAGNAFTAAVEERATAEGAGVVRLCAKVEAELSELDDDEKQAFLDDLGLKEPGLHRLVHAAYALLDLITFSHRRDRRR